MTTKADVVICGAGIAGISAAYHLAVKRGVRNVVLVDERAPLSLTSDKSTECYRNWWPGPGEAMVRLMNRSIDLLEELADESDNYFHLNRRGYVFLTADPRHIPVYQRSAEEISSLGAGPLRVHTGRPDDPPYGRSPGHGFHDQPTGADLVLDPQLIRHHFPFVSEEVVAILHARRCGWVSAQQLGMYLWQQAQAHGARLLSGRVTGVATSGGRVVGVYLAGSEVSQLSTGAFVVAAGPHLKRVGAMMGVELPVFNELHSSVAFNDTLGVVPRDAPLMIWSDAVALPWSPEEREELAGDEETQWLLQPLPTGVHFRPEGGAGSQTLLMLWTYDVEVKEPTWPLTFDPYYPEVVLRGLTRMVPGLAAYLGRMGRPVVDGGYYCKTQENRPLIGPLPVEGAYVIGALSGYGIMASQAAGELLAAHITGGELPAYAPSFRLERYDDPAYQALLATWDAQSGQL
ncbi:MAG: FAD-binding oxidoreductase [Chloroflexota bacterium]